MADEKPNLTGLNTILSLLHEDDDSKPTELPVVKATLIGNYRMEIKSYVLEDGRVLASMKAYAPEGGILPSRETILGDLIHITLHMFDESGG